MLINPDRWLVRQRGPQRRLRLFCFPFGGASAACFGGWQSGLHPEIEVCAVQLPGRGEHAEPPLESLPLLVERLAAVVAAEDGLPFAFFGHNFGALLAFELARFCRRAGLRMPLQLLVSACQPPRLRVPAPPMPAAPADRPGGESGYPGLMSMMMAMRIDWMLDSTYAYHPEAPLALPVTALGALRDPHVQVNQLHRWQAETTQPVRVHCFDGEHFFIDSERAAVLACLDRELAPLRALAG